MPLPNDVRARLSVASRVGAAVFGGYALTSAAASLLALSLPLPRDEAALLAMMLSFLIYALAVMWAFHTRSATRAWIAMIGPAAVLGLIGWLLGAGGGA